MVYPVTEVGFKMLSEELSRLTKRRHELSERVEDSRSAEDISENSEYTMAREELELNEEKIARIEDKLSRARIIYASEISEDIIAFGCVFQLFNRDTKERLKLQIVSEDEADVKEGKISNNSPFARAFLGKEKGDIVFYESPKGDEIEYKVSSISKPK